MNRLIDKISKHLIFLGYKADVVEPEKEGHSPMILATQPNKSNFVILEVSPNRVWCQANFTTEKSLAPGMTDFINEINKDFLVSRLFFEVDKGLVVLRIRAIYNGLYDKETFGQFWDSVQFDLQKMLALDRERRIFY